MILLLLKILDFLKSTMLLKKQTTLPSSIQSGEDGKEPPKTDSDLSTNFLDPLMKSQRQALDRSKIESMAKSIAMFNGVDQDLVIAIIEVESAFDHLAIRYESHYKWLFKPEEYAVKCRISKDTEEVMQKCSFGLMQVMGAVARELGHERSLLELLQPEISIKYGCLKISELMMRYMSEADVISAYNQGSPAKRDGKYVNQVYVDKVQKILSFRRVKVPPS